MFRSVHIMSQQVLLEKEAVSWHDFAVQLNQLSEQQKQFAQYSVSVRASMLLRFAQRLSEQRDVLAKMVCEEVGRCLRECEAEIDKSIELIKYYAKLSPELLADKTIATQASLSQVRFEPLGVVLAVMPWNYPIWQILRFAIPALCAGNACVVKPAPSVYRVSVALLQCVEDLPLLLAPLANEDVEAAIAACDALAFTGSTSTGKHLAALAGKHLKKTVLELGGSNAFIVLPDANIQQAAKDACYSRFRDAGQSCNAAKRLIVCSEIADDFLAAFLAECAKLNMGDPSLDETTLAPLHRADLRQTVHEQVLDAVQCGAKLLCGGFIPNGVSWFYPATVLDDVHAQCRVYHEEVFGPVASVLRADNIEHAIQLANDTSFGLGASIYSADIDKAWEYAKRIQAGSVFINRHTSSDLRLPFGGIKQSGYGRELSEFGLYEFVNVKSYWQK